MCDYGFLAKHEFHIAEPAFPSAKSITLWNQRTGVDGFSSVSGMVRRLTSCCTLLDNTSSLGNRRFGRA